MNIRELSIGDWVRDSNGIIAKVRGIENWDDGYILNVQTASGSICVLSATGALPIPLTPEILESNGFTFKHKGIEFDHYETNFENGKTLLLSFDRGEHYYLMYEEKGERGLHQIDCPLGYVHQLQHAIRFARIEKEIIL